MNIFDIFGRDSGLLSDDANSTVLIKSCKGSEVLLGDGWCVVRADECVSVCWVANYEYLDGLLCNSVDRFALSFEDFGICR